MLSSEDSTYELCYVQIAIILDHSHYLQKIKFESCYLQMITFQLFVLSADDTTILGSFVLSAEDKFEYIYYSEIPTYAIFRRHIGLCMLSSEDSTWVIHAIYRR